MPLPVDLADWRVASCFLVAAVDVCVAILVLRLAVAEPDALFF